MAVPKLTIGRLRLNENELRGLDEQPAGIDSRSMKISGIETLGVRGYDDLRRVVADVTNSAGRMVQVRFDTKTDWDAYYQIENTSAKMMEWKIGGGSTVEWEFELMRLGSPNDIDIESRMSGSPALLNDFSALGERNHAPPIGHTAYWSGPAQPSQVVRSTPDGPIIVYRNLNATTNPRYNCITSQYPRGRVKFTDAKGFERTGVNFLTPSEGWSLDNGLVKIERVVGDAFTWRISAYDPAAGWEVKNWNFTVGGTAQLAPVSLSVIRNDFEAVVVRLLWNVSPSGRVQADLTLRRGSRLVEIYSKAQLSSTLGIAAATSEAGTATSGYIAATANDPAGNRYVIGSARTFTAAASTGGLSKATTVVFDAFIGAVLNGGSAVAGDTAADLYQQYIGFPAERVTGVRL